MSRGLNKPNLLFILADQMRFDALGALQPWLKTPHLDRLAASGVRFDHACCAAQPCVAARASLLTGRYAELHRTWGNADLLPPPERTWVQQLDRAGYQCIAVGRTHRIHRGFEPVRVPYGDSFPMIDYTDVHEIPWGERGVIEPSPAPMERFYETRVTDTACDLLEDLNRNQPFALYCGYIIPHPPFVIPEPYASMYDADQVPWDEAQRPEPMLMEAHRAFCPPAFDQHRQRLAAAYYFGMVTLLDEYVGRLLDRLDALGLAGSTLVVFTSDHGEQLGHRGLWNKGYCYDPSLRIPLILRQPGAMPGGRVSPAMVSAVDVGPTILEALGVAAMPHRSGRSFWQVAKGETDAHRSWIYSSYADGRGVVYRDATWKYGDCLLPDGRRLVELYDLAADPAEQQNLAADGRQVEMIEQIRQRLWMMQRTELIEGQVALFPDNTQPATFNAQFRR